MLTCALIVLECFCQIANCNDFYTRLLAISHDRSVEVTLDSLVTLAKTEGDIVFVDMYNPKAFGEKLIIATSEGGADAISSSFYEIRTTPGMVSISPRDTEMRSSFLTKKLGSLSLENISPSEAIRRIGVATGIALFYNDDRRLESNILKEIDLSGKSVEEALVKLARALGANQVFLSAAVSPDGKRLKGPTIVTF